MHYTQKGLSFLIVLTLCIQPVFAEERIPEEANLPVEAPTELPLTEATPNVSAEVTPFEEVGSTSSEVTTPVSTTEFISASVEEPTTQKKSGIDILDELPSTESDYVEGEVLIKYKDTKIDLTKTSGRKTASSIAKGASLKKKDDMRESNISLLEITDSDTVEEKIDELENNPNVEYAQPNFIYTPSSITPPNDPLWTELWGLDNQGQSVNEYPGTPNADINAPEAWEINEGTNASVIVAIIDTGVAYNHPDLQANMWDGTNCKDENGNAINGGCNHGYDYEENDVTPLPTYSSHGTHIAGTIAAVKNNTVGISGVAPSAKIMALKTSLTTEEIVKSIQFATQNGAHIINASWEGPGEDLILRSAIEAFPGLFVAAAGNSAHDNDDISALYRTYPSDFDLPNIISVAATDQDDNLAYFSNFGTISVDVGAPGVNIYSTVANEAQIFTETFDSVVPPNVPSGWVKGGDDNNWSTYDTGMPEWANILSTDSSYPYMDNILGTTMTSPTIDLRSGNAVIDFWTACDTEYDPEFWTDYIQLEYSADGHNFSDDMLRWDEMLLDLLNGEDPLDDAGGAIFHVENIPISNQFSTDAFKFQFRWKTNSRDSDHYGCAVDTIHISTYGDGSNEQYGYSDGTSMAAPHVAGLAALIEGYNPSLTPAEVKALILSTGSTSPSLMGKTVTGKRIDAQKALQAANPALVPVITISGVQSSVSTTSATITWTTSHPATSQVVYGTSSRIAATGTLNFGYPSSTPEDTTLSTNHSVTVSDLLRGTTYFFRPVSHATPPPVVGVEVSATTPLPDTTAPVITLSGANPMHIPKFSIFEEPGAIAIDNEDGDITNRIVYGGNLDTSIPKEYAISYTVSDNAGNVTRVNRFVTVDKLSLSNEQSSGVNSESVTVSWNTSNPATSRVLWDTVTHPGIATSTHPAPNYSYLNSTDEDTTLTTNHSVTISGLSPLSSYFFRPISHDATEEILGIEISATTTATPIVIPPPSKGGGSGGGGGGGGSSKKKTAVKTQAPVAPLTSVGTTTVVAKKTFTLHNSIGARNQEVTELQKILIKEGFLIVTLPTGYFGPITRTALVAYQRAHGIPQTGIVDEATRTKLNGNTTTSSADAQRIALIKVLQAKLLQLIAELQALKAR